MSFEMTSAAEILAFWAIAGYLLGAIPFGIVTARALGLGDLRQIGSGNIGATNVLRTGSKLGAALTLIGDAGKAGAAVLLARALAAEDAAQIAGFAAFFGHCYPIWLKFKGGKGVATGAGSLLPLHPFLLIGAALTWVIVTKATKKASIASIAVVPMLVLAFVLSGTPGWEIFALVGIGALVEIRHASNIKRLLSGTEPPVTGSTV